jgi:hypothetical protein
MAEARGWGGDSCGGCGAEDGGDLRVMDKPRALMCWNPDHEEPEDIDLDPLLLGMVLRLPKMGVEWSYDDRTRWIMMFYAIADGLYPESRSPSPEIKSRVQIGATEPADVAEQFKNTFDGDGQTTEIDVSRLTLAEPNAAEQPENGEAKHRFRPYAGSKDAASVAVEMIRQAGKPGCVWYDKTDGRIRITDTEYKGEDNEIIVGLYDLDARPGRIMADIKAARKGD